MLYHNIPSYLKSNQRFCNLHHELDKNGWMTKNPYNLKTQKLAQSNNLNKFSDFDKEFANFTDYYGIEIKVTDDIIKINLDHYI